MRAAPPVSVRCTGGAAWRGVQTFLPALAAGVAVGWALLLAGEGGDGGWRAAAAAAAVALLVGVIAWRLSRQPSAHLAWDGQQWRVDSLPATPSVMVDVGFWLLLRLHGEPLPRACWLGVGRNEAGAAWHGLRTALFTLAPPKAEASHV